MKLALRGAAWLTVFSLAGASRLLDAVRFEIEYRLTGAEPLTATTPIRCSHGKALDEQCESCSTGRFGR